MTGSAFDRAGNAEEVLKIAMQTLNEYAAVISLLWHPFCKPSIGQVIHEDDTGKQIAYSFARGIASGRSKANGVSGVLVDASGSTPNRITTQAQDLLEKAKTSPHLSEAIAVWGDPIRTWARLYRVAEEIRQHYDKKWPYVVGLCSKAEFKHFTNTANNAESSGIDSRHASGMHKPPKNPMSLAEATTFVGQILEKALRKS